MKEPNRTLALVLIAAVIYAAVIGVTCGCLYKEVFDWDANRWVEVYDWRTGIFIFMTLNLITFVMAFVALGRRGK